MSKRAGWIAAAMLLAAGCGGTTSSGAGDLPAGPIKIGMITSLTGGYASLGANDKLGALQAVDEINASGGINGHQIQLTILDDTTKPDQAVTAYNDLISQGNIGIVGPVFTNNDLAVVPLTQAKKIPFISTAAADQIVHAGGTLDGAVLSNVFQTPPSAARVGERLLQYMKDQGLSKMAIAHDTQSAFADSGTAAMKGSAAKYGVTFVTDETFETSQTQYQTMMAHIRASGAQGIMVWGTGTPPPLITHAWAAAGLKIPLMFSHASASTQFVKAVGQDGEGVIVGTSVATIGQSLPDSFPSKKEIMAMATTFQQKNGYYPPEFAFNAYAAVKLLSQGIKNANSTQPKKIDDALNSLSLNTAGGNFKYTKTDHYGIGIDWTAVAVIKGAQLVPTDFSLKILQSGK